MPTPTKVFLLHQWQRLVLSIIILPLTIPIHGTRTDLAEACRSWIAPHRRKMQTATRKQQTANLSQENRHPLITILQATSVINSSGFWTFDGLVRPRDSLSGSTGTYTSQLLSPKPQ